ncbi:unnamed protein product [Rotaria sordida]|uniref:PARP catalytic domain-containing protein n=1 Tax=Rotaria sordida TaxID=392033 RepID=A0A814ZEF5_9BILA|nr:unnamed protein product [Rotaria sordida]
MAQYFDFSTRQSSLSEIHDNSIVVASTITSITNEIIDVLQLEDNENKDEIINDLLENGRESLVKYQEDITHEIYTDVMNSNDNKLIILLKKYFQQKWETQYGISHQWFISFLRQYQNGENHYTYEHVLTRTTEYGNMYMKNDPILSIVLQLLFECIDDECLKETNIFNDLWFSITSDGLKAITNYSDYIVEDVMNEQLNKSQSTLFQALREYNRQAVFSLLEQNNIVDEQNLYDLILDDITEHGWLQKNTLFANMPSESTCNKQYNEQEESEHIIIPLDVSDNITVRFRQTNVLYPVRTHQNMTVKEVIADVCRQANANICNNCYLWFDSRELDINDTIYQSGLYKSSNSTKDLPEVRLKYIQILQSSTHIGTQISLASPEHISYHELFNIPLPSTINNISPTVVKEIAEQIIQHSSSVSQSLCNSGTVLIPLPNCSKQSIDSLPTIVLTAPLSPNQFDWNVFLDCLADDLEINRTDLIIVNVEKGSTKFMIKLRTKLLQASEIVNKVARKLLFMCLPKCKKFVDEYTTSTTSDIRVELENFAKEKVIEDKTSLSFDEIDVALRLCERPAIINDTSWKFLQEKSRQIHTCVIQSIQSCRDEYVIDHASIVYNEHIYHEYQSLTTTDKNEKILFHGTNTINFNGIFEKNFQYISQAKRTDEGWYGQGIYFSSSPEKALNYAKSNSAFSYLICSLVRLDKILTVTDMKYKGKPMHSDYDTHYIPIRINGDPISRGEIPCFEEFVIKKSDQIIPLYIVGLLKVSRFVIWRDAKITNEFNSSIFEDMTQRYTYNIYGTQTSIEALNILNIKLTNNDSMKCVIVTNGADDGEDFVRQCRSIRSSLPIIIFCQNKTYHQQWAAKLSHPKIHVTSSPTDVFDFITNTLQQ